MFSLFNLKEKSRFWSESVIRGGMFTYCIFEFLHFFFLNITEERSSSSCSSSFFFFFFFLFFFFCVMLSANVQILMIWNL